MTLNLCLLPLGSRLRTRDGRSARLLATDVRGEYPCVVSVESRNSSDDVYTVNATGRHTFDENGDRDIVAIEKPKHRVRVLVFKPTNDEPPWAVAVHEAQDTFNARADQIATFSANLIAADQIFDIEENV